LSAEEQERAKVMHAGGATPNKIATSMNRSHHTLQKYLRRPEVQQVVGVQREELAGMFDSVAFRVVDSVSDEDVKKANLVQKMTSAGIAVDKAALLRGEMPPTINLTVLMDVVEAIKARRNGQVEPPPQAPALPPPVPEP